MSGGGKAVVGGGIIGVVALLLMMFGGETGQVIGTVLNQTQGTTQSSEQVQTRELSSVAQELQADFYAGIWASYNKEKLEAGDIELAISAAQAVGDDAIQSRMQGHVQPETFTHGTSAERKFWFMKGYNSGDINQGDIERIYNSINY